MTRSGRRGQHGQAIVIVAAMMAVLLGFVGLAIDSSRLIDARRVLQDSVDAAALAAAESFQAGKGWSVSQTNAVALFETDSRLASGESCSPAFAQPAPGSPITVNCTMAGGYSLALTAADNGPAGQSFSLSARHSVSAALMQAIGQFGSLVVQAASSATANDLALTPAIGGLASNNCYGTPGIDPIQLSGSATITGDAVSNGSFVVPTGSAPLIAGNVLTRCGPPTNAGNIGYRCWRSGASSPCPANNTLGRLLSTNSRLADPRFTAPASAPQSGLPPAGQVVWGPATYATDPQFGSLGPRCYFLTPGVYEWQAGLTINAGIVSNQLRPPAEPGPVPFWNSNGARCGGDFTLSSQGSSENGVNGTFAIVVTSARVDGGATRESAPSQCKLTPTLSSSALSVQISNVPGAASYNLYTTAAGGSCAGPFHRFGSISSNAGAQKNDVTSGCPGTTNCTLGVSPSTPAVFDNSSFPGSSGTAPPDNEVANSFGASLPNQNAPRAQSPSGTNRGDLANENSCADASGTPAYCRAAITPGAVLMKVTGTGCINVKTTPGGDLHLFSGYQYNWILVHEPNTTTCTNTWSGKSISAAIGLVYAPGAAFNLDGTAALTAPTGGVMAGTVSVNNSVATFDPAYAPLPPATRLTG